MKILKQLVIIGVFIATYTVGRSYPGIVLQWFIAYGAYWLAKKIASKHKPSHDKDSKRGKISVILAVLGLSGILSPIVGFVFALPAYVIAQHLLSSDYKKKKVLIWFTGILTLLCILNANLGTIKFGGY